MLTTLTLLQPSFWLLLAAIPTFTLGYRLTRPGENGEDPTLTRWLARVGPSSQTLRDVTVQIVDKHEVVSEGKMLLLSATRDENYQPRDPDIWDRYSRRNVSASQYVNIDAAKDVYRRKYFAEQDRQAQWAEQQASQKQD
jgi:hypothetical protein